MSTSPPDFEQFDEYEPENTAPARVFVDGYRTPIINEGVTVRKRKEGPTSFMGTGKIVFPAQSHSIDWLRRIDPFDPVTIQFHSARGASRPLTTNVGEDSEQGEMINTFRGFITDIGSHGSSQLAAQARVVDPATLLSKINAHVTIGAANTIDDVLSYIVGTFNDEQYVFDDVGVATRGDIDTSSTIADILNTDKDNGKIKSFNEYEHSLSDIIEWLREEAGIRSWFQPEEYGDDPQLFLTFVKKPTVRSFQAQSIGGDVTILHNDALRNINPINTIEVIGDVPLKDHATGTIAPWVGKDYPYAIVRSETLYERSNYTELSETQTTNRAHLQSVENIAKSRLKERVKNTGEGKIVTTQSPRLQPYTTLEAKPIVDDRLEDVDHLTYEIDRSVHRAAADDRGILSWSEFRVSMHIPIDDMTIVESGHRDKKDSIDVADIALGPYIITRKAIDEILS